MRTMVDLAVAVVLVTAAGLPFWSARADDALPPSVQASIDDNVKACDDKTKLEAGFLTRRDINADGREDFILDYGHFICGDSVSYYCGSAGCLTTVFASLPGGGYVKVWDENVESIDFKTVRGRPAILLALHGSDCGRAGADACHSTLYWNGRTFAKAR